MMSWEETKEELQTVKSALVKAHWEIQEGAKFMEARLTTEYDRAMNREYGRICRVLGMLEGQIESLDNQINKLK